MFFYENDCIKILNWFLGDCGKTTKNDEKIKCFNMKSILFKIFK